MEAITIITLVSSPGCSQCKKAVKELRDKEIDFEHLSIMTMNPENAEEYKNKAIEKGQQSFPIILKDNEIVQLEEVIN